MLNLGEQTVRDYRNLFLVPRLASCTDKRPPGRPSKRSKTQRRELADLIKAGPQAAGSTSGGWHTPMIQDLIHTRCGVSYPPPSLATLLHPLGFSAQKAPLVSDHLNEAKRLEWRQTEWPRILRQARQRKAWLLCGDEASCAPWGSLRSPWAPKGEHPEVRTSGKRQGYKVFGLIDYFSGPCFDKTQKGRLPSESDAAFLLDVLSQTRRPVSGMQAGARYHTSKVMQALFDTPAARLTVTQLPAYSPDFNPMTHLWKKVKKAATHLKYFPEFTH